MTLPPLPAGIPATGADRARLRECFLFSGLTDKEAEKAEALADAHVYRYAAGYSDKYALAIKIHKLSVLVRNFYRTVVHFVRSIRYRIEFGMKRRSLFSEFLLNLSRTLRYKAYERILATDFIHEFIDRRIY